MAKLVAAGIAAPIWFTVLVIVQSLFQPDYSQVALPISALAAWPYGWIQNVNFYVYGVLVTAYAIGLHFWIRQTRTGAIGPVLLAMCGLGAVVAGIFPWRMVDGVPTESPGHVVGALMHFLGAAIGLIVTSRRMTGDSRWRSLANYALASGIVMLVLFVTFAIFGLPDGAKG